MLSGILRLPKTQTWLHRPKHAIVAVISSLISTSDSHLAMKVSRLTHTLLYIIQHSLCIMDQRIIYCEFNSIFLFAHTHTHAHNSLTERLVWSDSNVILIARGDDSLSPLCWYPQAWQSFGHTSLCCTSANTGTISPLCLFQSLSPFTLSLSLSLLLLSGWHFSNLNLRYTSEWFYCTTCVWTHENIKYTFCGWNQCISSNIIPIVVFD